MIKVLAAGTWCGLVALGASYGATAWKSRAVASTAPAQPEPVAALELRNARPLNIPIIADGAVQGYVIAQFGFTIEKVAGAKLAISPEAVLLDEAFRAIYSDDQLNFRRLERYDLNRLTSDLVGRVRRRLGSDAFREVIVQEFNFVALSDLRQ